LKLNPFRDYKIKLRSVKSPYSGVNLIALSWL